MAVIGELVVWGAALCPLVDKGEIDFRWMFSSALRAFWPPRCSLTPRSRAAATHQLRYMTLGSSSAIAAQTMSSVPNRVATCQKRTFRTLPLAPLLVPPLCSPCVRWALTT